VIPKNSLGAKGEQEARKYLKKKGYSIIESNCRIGGSEIDIIMVKKDFLIFVEVKSRCSSDAGLPEEFVDKKKIAKIIMGAKLYSTRKKFREMFVRFDIVSILLSDGKFKIDHIVNAFGSDDV